MKIKWYGHSAFLITSDQGAKIMIDPYEPGAFGGQLSYGKIKDQVDIVLTTHDHADHNYTKDLPGTPQIVKGSGPKTAKGISMKGISTYHDPSQGSERGANTIFTLKIDNIQLCHLGDLGHLLSDKELADIAPVEDFLKGKTNTKRPKASEATFDKATLPQQMEIVVLEHAL
jgi:L-ascorbate metabolism protein UlaG (beta-lactamase superfamily)